MRPLSPGSTDVQRTSAPCSRPTRAERPLVVGIAHPAFRAVGGAEVLLSRYAMYLRARGHRIRLVTSAIDAALWGDITEQADVRVLENRWTDHVGIPFTHPKIARRLDRHARALDGVDVIIGANYPGNAAAAMVREGSRSLWACMEPSRRLYPRETLPMLTARLHSTPRHEDSALLHSMRSIIERAVVTSRFDARAAQRATDRRLVPRIARVLAISEYTAASVRRIYGRAADAIIYPTVRVPVPPTRAPGISTAGLRVLVHGRMDLIKNMETVLRGFAAFRAAHAGAHELHVVGTGPDLSRLQRLARDIELGSAVQFHGFLPAERMRALYARCDVFASLPIDEPFGMVFPEAALHGLLLIGPDHGGPMEILEGGAIGWTIDAFSPAALAETLERASRLSIAETERRRTRAAQACAQRYAPQLTLPAIEDHLLALATA